MQREVEIVRSIEGENDFSGKRYIWLNDPNTAFIKGWIVEELDNNQILVQCEDGSVCISLSMLFIILTLLTATTSQR